MPKIALTNMQGANVGEIELADGIFAVPMNEPVVHQVIVAQLANKRQGTQSALGRTEVAGGGKKPWRQKGTGRARQGSTRAPQWDARRRGLRAQAPRLFQERAAQGEAPGHEVRSVRQGCGRRDGRARSADLRNPQDPRDGQGPFRHRRREEDPAGPPGKDETIARVSNNIPGLKLAFVNTINVLDILGCDKLVVVKDAVAQIEEVYA